jgi:hypothetical protein
MRREDAEHAAFLSDTAWCVMLANQTIRTDDRTAHFTGMTRRTLLIDRSLLGFLLRRANGRPDLVPMITDPARFALGGGTADAIIVRVGAPRP